jgi:hypothetical protein
MGLASQACQRDHYGRIEFMPPNCAELRIRSARTTWNAGSGRHTLRGVPSAPPPDCLAGGKPRGGSHEGQAPQADPCVRRLATVGCIAAGLAVPAAAGAILPNDPTSSAQQPYTLPPSFHTEVQSSAQQQQPFTLPTRFRTEIQTDVQTESPVTASQPRVESDPNPTTKAIALRRSFASSQPSSAPAPAVIRQIETVTDDSGRTLAIVLASVALAVALCSLGYATFRLAHIQRRELGSGSH